MDIMSAMFIQRFRISVPINGREIKKNKTTQMIEIHDMITVKRLLIWQLPDWWKEFHNHKDFYH